jgi:hypothetical protein
VKVLTALCLLAGFAALAGMASVMGALLLGAGLTLLVAAGGFALLSLACALGAAVLSFHRTPTPATTLPAVARVVRAAAP